MIADILTVMWKEWKEILAWGGGRSRFSLPIAIGVFGVLLPLQVGPVLVTSPLGLLYWTWLPVFLTAPVVADAFAGERERHTLETLLASRLPDRAILLGKAGAVVAYAVGVAWLSLLVALLTIHLAHGRGTPVWFPAGIGWTVPVFSLLAAGLGAGAGVLVSLRAATVRQAQQALSITLMLLVFLPSFGIGQLPDAWRARLPELLSTWGIQPVLIGAGVVLLLLNLIVYAAAAARFRRSRLILD